MNTDVCVCLCVCLCRLFRIVKVNRVLLISVRATTKQNYAKEVANYSANNETQKYYVADPWLTLDATLRSRQSCPAAGISNKEKKRNTKILVHGLYRNCCVYINIDCECRTDECIKCDKIKYTQRGTEKCAKF